jgi:elongator complex protein 6
LKSLRLENLAPAINSQLRSQASTETLTRTRAPTKTIVIIDGLDFLLASEADLDAVKIQQFISSIRSESHAVILTCSADSPLLHNRHDAATPLEYEHTNFVTALAHQSSWVMQLRGLDTGAAKDVTGVLRVSRGGSYDEDSTKSRLEEGEWLYQLKRDGSVRVWSRGQ